MVLGLSISGIEIMVMIWTPSTVCDSLLTEMSGKINLLLDLAGAEIPLSQRVIRYTDARPQGDEKERGKGHAAGNQEGY